MNYKKQYIKLIRKAQQNPLPTLSIDGIKKKVYTEKHHIFPKSIFGKNNLLVKLTPKEHFVAHLLLWKYYQKKYGNKDRRTHKMSASFWYMNNISGKVTSRVYCSIRKQIVAQMLGNTYQNGVKASDETKLKLSLARIGNKNKLGKKESLETRTKKSNNNKGSGNPMYGKTHTKESREKIGNAHTGERNHFYGKKRPEHSEKMKKIWADKKSGDSSV